MFRDYWVRAFNSIEFIAVAVLIAVITTTAICAPAPQRDLAIKTQSLGYSHLVTRQQPNYSPLDK